MELDKVASSKINSSSQKDRSSFFSFGKDEISYPPFFQPKLTINQPNDPYEQEADAMADKVMRMEQPGVQLKPLPITQIQRKCTHCEDEENKMQRKEINGDEATADSSLENYVGGLSSGGQTLPNEVRNFYEPRFGYDFSNVKVHTDSVAAKSAQSINALAYTSGNNIVFSKDQYSPNTASGKRLLGHELTHVIQQSKSINKKIQKFTASCRGLLNSPVASLGRILSGTAIHYAIIADFATTVSGGLSSFGIPGASATPFRTAGLCGEDIPTILPQVIGGRAGMGYPDLAARLGPVMQIAEIKPASWNCAVDGTFQLGGYITQGNASDPAQVAWRTASGIISVVPMLPSIYPGRTLVIGNYTVIIDWCMPGLLVYQVIGSNLPQSVPVPAPNPGRVPSPVLVRERSSWEIIREFAEEAIRSGRTARESIETFLRENPALIDLIIAVGIAGLVATFAEDIATLGVGILDDLITVPFFARLIAIALEMRQALTVGVAASTLITAH